MLADGIEVIIPKEDRELYEQTLNEATKLFDLELEHEQYDFIYYMNVNNYIAQTEEKSIKQKGLFVTKPVLGNSVDTLIIAKALEAYFVNDIDFSEFICNPEEYGNHIYDYCKSNKIGRDFNVIHNGIVQQQLNRYYFQEGAPYLYKQKPGGSLMHVNVGQGVYLYNNHQEKSFEEYNINYKYYVKKCRDIIDELNNFNQLTLF